MPVGIRECARNRLGYIECAYVAVTSHLFLRFYSFYSPFFVSDVPARVTADKEGGR